MCLRGVISFEALFSFFLYFYSSMFLVGLACTSVDYFGATICSSFIDGNGVMEAILMCIV